MLHATDWRARGVDPKNIHGAVSVSGVFELEPLIHTSMNPDLRLNTENAAAWSPLRMKPVLTVPLLIVVGSSETSEFIRQSNLLWEAWPEVRPPGRNAMMMLPGKHHFSALFKETLALFN